MIRCIVLKKKKYSLGFVFLILAGSSKAVELRGLQAQSYDIVDYVNKKSLGGVDAGTPKIEFDVQQSLLIKAILLREEN